MSRPQTLRAVGFVAITLLLAWLLLAVAPRWRAEEYRVFESPDGSHKLVVLRIPSLFSVAPGQGGDAAGFVRLYDAQGNVLEEQDVDAVQNIDQVDWAPDGVAIKLFAEWKFDEPGR